VRGTNNPVILIMTEQHYRVTLSDAIAHYQAGDLTAKGLVHIYIKIRCKPGWTIKVDHKEVCPLLGIRKTAFYNAISRLKAEGSIDWEAPQGIVVSLSTSSGFRECGKESANAESQSANAESQSANAESQSANAELKSSEHLLDKDYSDSPNYYQLYFKFLSSLSQDKREKFLEFGLKKAGELPKPPILPQKWVERNWQELAAEFEKSHIATTKTDWSQHPQRDEWIEQIRQGRPRFIALGGPEKERELRRQFAEWAEANNLVWGTES
jgi:hypothetical protein